MLCAGCRCDAEYEQVERVVCSYQFMSGNGNVLFALQASIDNDPTPFSTARVVVDNSVWFKDS